MSLLGCLQSGHSSKLKWYSIVKLGRPYVRTQSSHNPCPHSWKCSGQLLRQTRQNMETLVSFQSLCPEERDIFTGFCAVPTIEHIEDVFGSKIWEIKLASDITVDRNYPRCIPRGYESKSILVATSAAISGTLTPCECKMLTNSLK